MDNELFEFVIEHWIEDDPNSSEYGTEQECLNGFKKWLQECPYDPEGHKHILEHFQEVFAKEILPGTYMPFTIGAPNGLDQN